MKTPLARMRTLRENAGRPGWWTDLQIDTLALCNNGIPKCPAEVERLESVASLGCCVCRIKGHGFSPAEVHHIRTRPDGQKYGAGIRASHFETIPLCPRHHRLGPMGVAFHAGEATWERTHFPELYLLDFTNTWLEITGRESSILPIRSELA